MAQGAASSGSVGAGQQDPFDGNSDVTVAIFIVKQMLSQMETMTPVQVVAVHPGSGSPPAAGTVDVQLLVSLLDGAGNATKQGKVSGLPYFRMQGGPWAIVCEPAVNDYGFIFAASRDISSVKSNPGQRPAASYRQYSFSDGIYVGGCLNPVPAATLWLKGDGTFKLTDKGGFVLQTDGSGNASITGNVIVNGSITANGITSNANVQVNGAIGATGNISAANSSMATVVSMLLHIHSAVNTPPTPGH